jgi:hypothetical protein
MDVSRIEDLTGALGTSSDGSCGSLGDEVGAEACCFGGGIGDPGRDVGLSAELGAKESVFGGGDVDGREGDNEGRGNEVSDADADEAPWLDSGVGMGRLPSGDSAGCTGDLSCGVIFGLGIVDGFSLFARLCA